MAKRKVGFFDRAQGEGLGDRPLASCSAGEDERARRSDVQTMTDEQPKLRCERIVVVSPGDNTDSNGLVYDHDVAIFVENRRASHGVRGGEGSRGGANVGGPPPAPVAPIGASGAF